MTRGFVVLLALIATSSPPEANAQSESAPLRIFLRGGPKITDVLVMFAADAGSIVGEERTRLEKFLKRGGGIVSIHDAIVTSRDPHWFKTIVGGAWENRVAKYFEGENICITSPPSIRSPEMHRISRLRTRCTGICT